MSSDTLSSHELHENQQLGRGKRHNFLRLLSKGLQHELKLSMLPGSKATQSPQTQP